MQNVSVAKLRAVNNIIRQAEQDIEYEIGTKAKLIIADILPELEATSVVDIICVSLGVDISDVKADGRIRELVDARIIMTYILRKCMHLTFCEIARLLKKDHTSIIYYTRQAQNLITGQDKKFVAKLNYVKNALSIQDIEIA